MNYWLVVSTHLKHTSQIGSSPQAGVKIKNVWNHHLDSFCFEPPSKTNLYKSNQTSSLVIFPKISGVVKIPPKKKVVTPWNSPINSEWLNKHQQPFLDSASSLRSFRQALKLRLGGLGSDGVSCGVLPRFFPKFDNEKKAKTDGSYPNEATFPTKPHIIHLQRGFTLNLPVTRPDRPRNSLSFFMVVACCPSSLWSTRIKTMSRG